ncbi:hypothetical protein ABUW04_05140 [Streptacidiphilus sp. N1-10]|uniref:Uncharacterized protein n=1 Tax=Streptacidiphilus jeojiensis TaxID=3229225 RepID=A0ABV6XH95_9ACTN
MSFSNRLMDKRFNGYRMMPIPNELDKIVQSVVHAYRNGTPHEREIMIGQIKARSAMRLAIYGERMAAVAVRTTTVAPLRDGLTALALAVTRIEDFREFLLLLTPVGHAADTIGVAPLSLVEDLKPLFPESALQLMHDFLAKAPQDRSLKSMGLKTRGTGNDFRYFG